LKRREIEKIPFFPVCRQFFQHHTQLLPLQLLLRFLPKLLSSEKSFKKKKKKKKIKPFFFLQLSKKQKTTKIGFQPNIQITM